MPSNRLNQFVNCIRKFYQQLTAILWKNVLIKCRSPLVLLFELTLPLILFLIIMAIRDKQHAEPNNVQHFPAKPLPSAGFVPLIQNFCDKRTAILNDKGYYIYPNSTANEMMDDIENIFKENHIRTALNFIDLVSNSTLEYKQNLMNEFHDSLAAFSRLSKYFPNNLCNTQSDNSKTANYTSIKSKNNENFYDNNLRINKNMKESGLAGLWLNMEETICGKIPDKESESDGKTASQKADNNHLDNLINMLSPINRNPVILYAPNATVTTKLIAQLNKQFETIEKLNKFAKKWQENSEKISENVKNPYMKDSIEKINALTCTWNHIMSKSNLSLFKGFENEQQLVDYFLNQAYNNNETVVASIIFENLNINSTEIPHNIRYKIRQNATLTQNTKRIRDRYWFPSPRSFGYQYYDYGFVWLQDAIDRVIISMHANTSILEPGTYVHQMPYPCYLNDNFLDMIEHVMPLCLSISFVYTVSMLSQAIVYEKELRLKEVMKIMGLENGVHLLAWFITYFIELTLIMSMVTVILHYGKILMHSEPFLVFILLELYAVTTICFTFLISALFSKAKLAAACAGIIYFLSYVPCIYISIREEVAVEIIPKWIKMCASLFSTTAFGLGSKYIAFYEHSGTGIKWSNVHLSPLEDDSFNSLISINFMIFDSFLYIFLAWYIEQVNPGYGLPQPWYFLLQYSYWFGTSKSKIQTSTENPKGFLSRVFTRLSFNNPKKIDRVMKTPNKLSYLLENEPLDLDAAVRIENLTKIYSNNKVALDNLSINFYENQITSFLGHNGAGKSTTLSILTGLIPSSSGSVMINGNNIENNLHKIRMSLGWCPQHNVLFEHMTVEEHFWFYAKLKLDGNSYITEMIEKMLRDTELVHKRSNLVNTLSGGMRRKLSVGISFIGNANVVLLDEPTAGVDPYARRAIWDLVLKYKTGRTIILSTHHMDEAEVLGDRVAIISNGKLICCGSPLFLKNTLSDGNKLNVVKKVVEREPSPLIRFDDENLANNDGGEGLLRFIRSFVPSAYLSKETLREFEFVLPFRERFSVGYWEMFEKLDKNLDRLGVSSYGVHDVSLEEVFLKASQLDEDSDKQVEDIDAPQKPLIDDFSEKNEKDLEFVYEELEIGWRLYWKQFLAIIIKRYLYNKRNWKSLVTQIVLPAWFICIAMTVALSAPGFSDLPPLELSTAQFYQLTKPGGIFVPFYYEPNLSGDDGSKKDYALTSEIVDTLRFVVGLGSMCALNRANLSLADFFDNSTKRLNLDFFGYQNSCSLVFDERADIDFRYFKLNDDDVYRNSTSIFGKFKLSKELYPSCKCMKDNSGFECSGEDSFRYPDAFHAITHETLLNISSSNESDYYLYTTDLYRLNRYGGLSFDFDSFQFSQNVRENKKRLARVWYNNKGFHALPVFLNVMNNALLRANIKKQLQKQNSELQSLIKSNEYSITAINHPMNQTNSYLSSEFIFEGSDVIISIFTIVAMSFVPASFVLFLVYERSSKSLHLQFMLGLNPFLYWITNFIWDLFNYLLPASCVIIILRVFNVPAYVDNGNFPAVIALFLLYGWSISPMMYPFSYVFNEPSNAYIFLIVINLFTGITCVVSSFFFQILTIDNSDAYTVFDVIKAFYLMFPPYCLGRGLIDIAYNHYSNDYYMQVGQLDKIRSPFEWDIANRNLIAMAAIGALSWIFTLILEYDWFKTRKLLSFSSKKYTEDREEVVESSEVAASSDSIFDNEDVDVSYERMRVCHGIRENTLQDLLAVYNLKKVYEKPDERSMWTRFKDRIKSRGGSRVKLGFNAVDNLCFGVPKGECFGLLGVNGAGKTTSFKMLTTDLEQTFGRIFVNDGKCCLDSVKDKRDFWKFIGYCPQFDALYDELTPADHLNLFARLKGIKTKYEAVVVDNLLARLDLLEYRQKPVSSLSLGNKRKLSTALALIGNPQILLLDEPTSGMDPGSKRYLWNEILNITQKSNKAVVLTSHSMEECEVLCTRLSIMVEGKFKCIGSVQHLKNRFGTGYMLTVKIRDLRCGDSDCNAIQILHRLLMEKVSDKCRLLQRNFNNIYQFELPINSNDCSMNLGDIYRFIETNKIRLGIVDYSLTQNTLDNVFVNFVKEHGEKNYSISNLNSTA